ncbi:MAG: 50S ribosomal protein L17 [Gemmatimonadetes bacterium]|nr:50S ribosomal protein L17 [Gemmatimonadota bacterium]
MRHGKRGRKLNRTASHKKAMLNNMATSLFANGKVRTTLPKAKELRGVAERLISFAKRGDLHARRQVLRRIQNKVVLTKLFEEIGPSFAERGGGYTRILKLGSRRGDSSELCLIELVADDAIIESDVEETESDASAEEEEVAEENKKDA